MPKIFDGQAALLGSDLTYTMLAKGAGKSVCGAALEPIFAKFIDLAD